MSRARTQRVCVGYRPVTGFPRDKNGKLELIYDYADVAVPDPAPETKTPQPKRGVQGELL